VKNLELSVKHLQGAQEHSSCLALIQTQCSTEECSTHQLTTYILKPGQGSTRLQCFGLLSILSLHRIGAEEVQRFPKYEEGVVCRVNSLTLLYFITAMAHQSPCTATLLNFNTNYPTSAHTHTHKHTHTETHTTHTYTNQVYSRQRHASQLANGCSVSMSNPRIDTQSTRHGQAMLTLATTGWPLYTQLRLEWE